MSSFCNCKSYSHFFSRNIIVYAIFNNQSFNDTLTNNIFSFEQLGPGLCSPFIHSIVSIDSVRDSESPDETVDAQADLGLCCPHMPVCFCMTLLIFSMLI